MADTKITDLSDLTAATGDELPVNRAGSDGKVTAGEIVALAVGRLQAVTTITTTGSTYDPPDGISFIIVECVGGGGSGANMAAGSATNAASGGGAGGYCRKKIASGTLGTGAVTITLGTGAVNTTTAAGGGAGTSTLFGTFCTACGGQGGVTGALSATGAAGGAATSGDINITGGFGQPSWGAGATAAALARRLGGEGGDSQWGRGGSGQMGVTGAIVSGNNAVGFGGGGGGGLSNAAAVSGSAAGGTGGGGMVVIWEYV